MRTVALILHKGQFVAVRDLNFPREPMHSGYINEERELRRGYYEARKRYSRAIANATPCNQAIALQILDEQYPGRQTGAAQQHYDVKNVIITELYHKRRRTFRVGESVRCSNINPLPGNSIAPPLQLGKFYMILSIELDKEGNQHLNVGLESDYSYITSYETGQRLPQGNKIHYCHPTRFE